MFWRAAFFALLMLAAVPARAAPDDLAIIIANQDYGASAPAVKYAARDGAAFAKAASDVLGVPAARVKVYANRTSAQMRRLFAPDGEVAALLRGRPKARLFLFYSGHGVPVGGDGHLLPVDIAPELAGSDAIAIGKLRDDLLGLVGAEGQLVMFLDACFSGRSGDGATIVRGASAGGPFNVAKSLAHQARAAVVTAAQGHQVAWWDEALPGAKARSREHGVFTDALVEALYAAAAAGRRELALADLEGALAERISERLGVLFPGLGRTQTPDVAATPGFSIAGLSDGGLGRDPDRAERERVRCRTLAHSSDAGEIVEFLSDCRSCTQSCRAALLQQASAVQGAARACREERAELERLVKRGAAERAAIDVLAKGAACPAVRGEAAAQLMRLEAAAAESASVDAEAEQRRQAALAALKRDQAPGPQAADQSQTQGQGADPAPDPALALKPGSGSEFRDRRADGSWCPECPELVVVPAGSFVMGSPDNEQDRLKHEGPQRTVTFRQPIAVGKFEVTFAEWDACVAAGGCTHRPRDEGWGRERRPVINVSWHDAQGYLLWISALTGREYRLLTEAEWEYAARAGQKSAFQTGRVATDLCLYGNVADISAQERDSSAKVPDGRYLRCRDGYINTAPVGAFKPNPWGLFDMTGNVWEWLADCWRERYDLPADKQPGGRTPCGPAGLQGGIRAARGGSFESRPGVLRLAYRNNLVAEFRAHDVGFRVARSIAGAAPAQKAPQPQPR